MNTTKIYIATNKINGKIYIGQTIESMKDRIRKHNAGIKRSNAKFPNAIKKYGIDNFDFDVVEEVESKYAHDKEKMYIAYFNSQDKRIGYNTSKGGEGAGGYKMTDEQRKRVSDAHKKPVPQRRKVIDVFNEYGEKIDQLRGQIACCEKYGVNRSAMSNNLVDLSTLVKTNKGKLQFKYNTNH